MARNQIAFLVGSGISRDSNAPTVDDLTKQVLESPWRSHTDWRFYPVPPNEGLASEGLAARAQHLLELVHDHIAGHLWIRDGRLPNYEDYFSCLKQLVQDETGEIVNPLIAKNAEALRSAAAWLYSEISPHIDDNKFASLAERASDLIQWIVFHGLRGLGPPVAMDLFTSAARDFDTVDIFSLNHDLLIEKQFESKGISYADGFGEADGDATLFNWSWNSEDSGTRLFKLHGSVDWFLFRFKKRGFDQYAKLRKDLDHSRDASGDRLNPLEVVPSFLTGTTVKEQAYGYSLYGELFEQFRHRLRDCDTLFCSGYGWSDKGINIRINQWLRDRAENKVVILHGSGGESLPEKRFWYFKWDNYVKAGKVIHLPKWFSQCTVDDLRKTVSN
jgi:hypothetical protein